MIKIIVVLLKNIWCVIASVLFGCVAALLMDFTCQFLKIPLPSFPVVGIFAAIFVVNSDLYLPGNGHKSFAITFVKMLIVWVSSVIGLLLSIMLAVYLNVNAFVAFLSMPVISATIALAFSKIRLSGKTPIS